jgi:hypothetical protein
MATIQEAVKRLRYVFTSEGADKVAADANKVGAAVTASATSQTRAVLDQEKSCASLERRFISTIRQQQDYQKIQDKVNAAVAQHPELGARANAVLAAAALQYGQAGVAARAFATATAGVQGQLVALAAGAGPVGTFIAGLGPLGLAAAVGLAALEKALTAMLSASHELAQKAIELRAFSDVTGLTTNQVQALRIEAAKFALTSDEAQTAIQNFTARFNDLRLGTGELYTQLGRINPALRDQMMATTDAGEALTLFGQALLKVDDIFQRNALVKAATGRGGLSASQFLAGLDVSKVTQSFEAAGRGLDANLIAKLRQTEIEIKELTNRLQNNFAKIFAADTLEGQRTFLDNLVRITDQIRKMKENDTILKFLGPTIGPALGFRPFESTQPKPSGVRGIGDEFGGAGLSSGAVTPEGTLANMKALAAAMGAASPPSEQLKIKLQELAIAQKAVGDKLSEAQKALANWVATEQQAIELEQRRLGALGESASVEERVAAIRQRLIVQQVTDRNLSDAEIANQARLAGARLTGVDAAQRQADALQVEVDTLGMAVGAATAYRIVQERINEARRNGEPLSDATVAALQKEADAVGALTQRLDNMRQAGELAGNFLNTFVETLIRGEGASKAFAASLQGLGSSITQAASKQIGSSLVSSIGGSAIGSSLGEGLGSLFGTGASAFGGPIAGLAVGAGVSLIGGLFDHSKQQQQEQAVFEQQMQQASSAAARFQAFTNRQQTAGLDTSTLAGALSAFDIQAQQERLDEARQAFPQMVQLEQALAQERLAIVKRFDDQAAEQAAKAAADQAAAQQKADADALEAQQKAAAAAFEAQQKADAEALAARQKALADAQQNIDAVQRGLNDALGKGFLNQFADLLKQVDQARQDAQLLGGTSSSLVETFFGASAQKIVEDTGLVGDAFNELLTTFPQLSGVIHESTKAMQDAADKQKQILQQQIDQLNKAAGSIVNYVNNLLAGPGSTLSPQARLTQAQSTYNATLALANVGNIDALNRITSDAENLRTAARDFYGSSAQFQTIFNQITSQLLAIPAVSGSTDPVVIAIRDSITANTNVTTGTTTAVNTNVTATQGTTSAVSAQQALLNAISASTAATNTSVAVTNQLQNSAISIASSSNLLAAATKDIATNQLTEITSLLNISNNSNSQLAALNAALNNLVSIANSQLTALGFLGSIDGRIITTNTNLQTIDSRLVNVSTYTKTTADETTVIAGWAAGSQHALGGLIVGGVSGRDSVPGWLTPGEVVIREPVARNNPWLLDFNRTGRLPSGGGYANDNADVIAHLDRLVGTLVAVGEQISSDVKEVRRAVGDNTRDVSFEIKKLAG